MKRVLHPDRRRATQRGAALLTAMLTVVLVATFAAASLWQQWRSIEVETAERARIQSEWVLTGALDWARLVLREDVRASRSRPIDHLGEPWAVPLEEARLSSFLAADRNNSADTGSDMLDAFLSGQIIDLHSRLNVSNLFDESKGKTSEPDLIIFSRLFALLGLPDAELQQLAENLRFAKDRSPGNGSSPMAPLLPQRIEQLTWLGLPANTIAVLQPYITILDGRTSINLNTAGAEVLHAVIGVSMADAQRLVSARETRPFQTPQDALRAIGAPDSLMPEGQFAVAVVSHWFEVRSRLRLGELMVEERAVVQRDGEIVKTLQRMRGAAEPVAPVAETGTR